MRAEWRVVHEIAPGSAELPCYWKCSFMALPQTTYGNTSEPDIADIPVTQIGFQVLTNLADPWLMPHLAGWEVLSLPAQVSPCHPHQPSWDAPSPVLITGWDDNCVCREPDQMISQALFVSKPVKLCVLHTIRIKRTGSLSLRYTKNT